MTSIGERTNRSYQRRGVKGPQEGGRRFGVSRRFTRRGKKKMVRRVGRDSGSPVSSTLERKGELS